MRSKRAQYRAIAALAIAGFVALLACEIPAANARPARSARPYGEFDPLSVPVLAIVGLAEQRVSIYDSMGKILEAPVSSGATGYETPAGIYSIVQKEEEHHSNLYDDASMPFMERITWTGIALHAGVLPGYPASHGCVRMPLEFAEQLYQITKPGMRVVIMREEIAPADVPQPAIFTPGAASNNSGSTVPGVGVLRKLESVEEEKSSEADAAKRHEKEARVTAAKKNADAAAAARSLHAAEANLAKAEAELKAFEPAQGAAASPAPNAVAEAAKAKAAAKVEAAQAQLQTSKLQAQTASDNAKLAEEEARAAAVAMSTAMEAAEEASQNLSPVSVLVSRKTQRLYIRKGNQPVFEAPVRIRDADKPIGTFIFTALDYAGTSGSMRWNVVSMYKTPTNIEPFVQVKQTRTKLRSDELPVADVASAQAALDRLTVPEEAADRISRVVLPGSSLIVSDEGPSIETGKDTDFVLFMSGEPQGGIAIRQHNTASRRGRDEYDDAFGRSWGRRGRPGGGFPFFFSDD